MNDTMVTLKEVKRALLKYSNSKVIMFKVLCNSLWMNYKNINDIDFSKVKKVIIVFKNHNPTFVQIEEFISKYSKP